MQIIADMPNISEVTPMTHALDDFEFVLRSDEAEESRICGVPLCEKRNAGLCDREKDCSDNTGNRPRSRSSEKSGARKRYEKEYWQVSVPGQMSWKCMMSAPVFFFAPAAEKRSERTRSHHRR